MSSPFTGRSILVLPPFLPKGFFTIDFSSTVVTELKVLGETGMARGVHPPPGPLLFLLLFSYNVFHSVGRSLLVLDVSVFQELNLQTVEVTTFLLALLKCTKTRSQPGGIVTYESVSFDLETRVYEF